MVSRGVLIYYEIALLEQLVVILFGNAVLNDRGVQLLGERALDLDSLYLQTIGVQQVWKSPSSADGFSTANKRS